MKNETVMDELELWKFFPNTLCPHGSKRQFFVGYGSAGNVDVNEHDNKINITCQHSRNIDPILIAVKPTLPVLLPNEVDAEHVKNEPCLFKIKERSKEVKNMIFEFSRLKGYTRGACEEDKVEIVQLVKRLSAYQAEQTGKQPDANAAIEDELDLHDPMNSHSKIPRLGYCKTLVRKFKDVGNFNSLELVNHTYRGGCLTHLQGGGVNSILFPSGPQMSIINVYSLSPEKQRFRLHEGANFYANMHDRILEIYSKWIKSQGFCVIRCHRKCVRLRCDVSSGVSFVWSVITEKEFENDEHPTSVALSPYLAGEVCIATNKGNVLLWHQNGTLDSVCTDLVPRFPEDPWWQCHYGAHPRSLVVSDKTGASLYDLRKPTNHSGRCRDLFVLPHKSLHPRERIMITKRHPSQCFFHIIALQFSLVVVDERCPNHPYISVAENVISGVHDVILLGNQGNNEVIAFQMNIKDHQPRSTSAPWKISHIDDFLRLMTKQNVGSEKKTVSQRLCVPLGGVCGITHNDQDGMSVYQDYKAARREYGQDKTLCAGPGSANVRLSPTDIEHCEQWVAKLAAQVQTALANSPSVQGFLDASTTIDAISQLTYPHVLCALCMSGDTIPGTQGDRSPGDAEDEAVCQACGLSILESQAIRRAANEDNVVQNIGTLRYDQKLDALDTSQFTDAMSQILLKLWEGEVDDLSDLLKQLDKEREAKKQTEREGEQGQGEELTPVAAGSGETIEGAEESGLDEPDATAEEQLASTGDSQGSAGASSQAVAGPSTPATPGRLLPDLSPSSSPSSSFTFPATPTGLDFSLPLFSPKKSQGRDGSTRSLSSGASSRSHNAGFLMTPARVRHLPARTSYASPVIQAPSPRTALPGTSDQSFISLLGSRSPLLGSQQSQSQSQGRPKKKKRKLVEGF